MIETQNQEIDRLEHQISNYGNQEKQPEKIEKYPESKPSSKPIEAKPIEKKIDLGVYQYPLRGGKTGKEDEPKWIIGTFIPNKYISETHPKGHEGVDVGGPRGVPAYSPGPGIVTETGVGQNSGNFIKIKFDPDDRLTSFMCHFDQVLVSKGDRVDQNKIIGYNGDSGNARKFGTACHVHTEFKLDNNLIDPMNIFGKPVGSFQSNKSNNTDNSTKSAILQLSESFLKLLG